MWSEGWPKWVDEGDLVGPNPHSPRKRIEIVPLSDAERLRATLRPMVVEWINEGFTTPPYTAEQYDLFEWLDLSGEDLIYDIARAALTDEGERRALTHQEFMEVDDYIREKYGITDEGERDGVKTHLSFQEVRAAAHNLAEQRQKARMDFERYSKEAAEAEHEYRKRLAVAFAQYRAADKGSGEAEILAQGDVADQRRARDIAEGLRRSALLRIEEVERNQATLRQLAEFSKDLETVG